MLTIVESHTLLSASILINVITNYKHSQQEGSRHNTLQNLSETKLTNLHIKANSHTQLNYLICSFYRSILTHITTWSSPLPAFCLHKGTVLPSLETNTAKHFGSSSGLVFSTCSHNFQTFSSLKFFLCITFRF